MEYIQSAGVVVLKEGEVLLVRHTGGARLRTGAVGLPAGRLGVGESTKEAAVRELREESGLITDEESLIKLPQTFKATLETKEGPKNLELTAFLCTSYSGELTISHETEPFWAKLTELDDIETIGDTKNAIRDALFVSQDLNVT